MNRNKEWLEIWERKYNAFNENTDPHILDGFDGMSLKEWQQLVHFFLEKIKVGGHDTVLEVGCGAGAFIKEIDNYHKLYGVDYSPKAIEAISKIIDGEFYTAEASSLPFDDNTFDKVLSFGVYFYFSSYDYARRAFCEMVRVMKPQGTLFIGDINDLEKKDIALALRGASDQGRKSKYLSKKEVDHIYYPKSFFMDLANEHNLKIEFIDEGDEISFYYNSQYRYSIILESN